MYVNNSIDVFLNNFEFTDANVEKNVFNRLIIDI
jgi:regulatory protein YycH of two-component signal transduction system YycFG